MSYCPFVFWRKTCISKRQCAISFLRIDNYTCNGHRCFLCSTVITSYRGTGENCFSNLIRLMETKLMIMRFEVDGFFFFSRVHPRWWSVLCHMHCDVRIYRYIFIIIIFFFFSKSRVRHDIGNTEQTSELRQ